MDPNAIRLIDETEIDFLTALPDQGRHIPRLAFHDGQRFSIYEPHESGKLMVLHPLDTNHSHYVAREAADASRDLHDVFWEAVIQHFSVNALARVANAVRSDMMNALASVHQYFVTLQYSNTYSDWADAAVVATQVEYALANHRSFYDLMNGVVTNFRPADFRKKAAMSDSFRVTTQTSDDELRKKFGVPECFIQAIRRHEIPFTIIRELRDAVLHGGRSPAQIILRYDDGFAAPVKSPVGNALSRLGLLQPALVRNGWSVSLLPLLAFIARDILELATDIGRCMASAEDAPQSIATGYHVFFRSSLNVHALKLLEYIEAHWVAPASVLPLAARESAG